MRSSFRKCWASTKSTPICISTRADTDIYGRPWRNVYLDTLASALSVAVVDDGDKTLKIWVQRGRERKETLKLTRKQLCKMGVQPRSVLAPLSSMDAPAKFNDPPSRAAEML